MKDSRVLLSVYLDKQLEADLVDTLIELECVSGFTLSPVFGFSREHGQLNRDEQVAGSRKQVKAEIIHSPTDTGIILSSLCALNAYHSPRYTVTSLLDEGHL